MESRVLSTGQCGTFATQAFSKYDVILSETVPLLQVKQSEEIKVNDESSMNSILDAYGSLEPSQREKVLELYHPNLDNPQREEIIAVHRAKAVAKNYVSSKGSKFGEEELTKVIMVYLCNAFEGGSVYYKASRINHSCNPNCIYTINESTINVTAATDIQIGEEIHVSYLGIFLWAGKQNRRSNLQRDKYFTCECDRCCKESDFASGIPCFKCNPRESGKFLKEEEQWEEVPIAYAYPNEQGHLSCSQCNTLQEPSKELNPIMIKVSDKVAARLSERHDADTSKPVSAEEMDINLEIDEQLFQMSLSILGPKHWATNTMHLSLLDRSLSSFNAAMLLGEMPSFEELAEACDSLEQLWHFCNGTNLKIGPLPLLFKQTLGVARSLVSLGDSKSKKFANEWVNRVDMKGYAAAFEREGMVKVIEAINSAWEKSNTGMDINLNAHGDEDMEVDDGVAQGRKKRVKN